MSAIDFALKAAAQKFQAATGVDVIYRRTEDVREYPIRASLSTSNPRNRQTVHGVSIRSDCIDWIVSADQIDFLPETFDRIIDGDDEYEVTAPDESKREACYRFIGRRTQIRIHTIAVI